MVECCKKFAYRCLVKRHGAVARPCPSFKNEIRRWGSAVGTVRRLRLHLSARLLFCGHWCLIIAGTNFLDDWVCRCRCIGRSRLSGSRCIYHSASLVLLPRRHFIHGFKQHLLQHHLQQPHQVLDSLNETREASLLIPGTREYWAVTSSMKASVFQWKVGTHDLTAGTPEEAGTSSRNAKQKQDRRCRVLYAAATIQSTSIDTSTDQIIEESGSGDDKHQCSQYGRRAER